MKLLLNTEQDIAFLNGKFILQIDNDTPSKTLMDMDWGFAKEKRLKLCVGMGFIDLYGYHIKFDSFKEFQAYFNDYLFEYSVVKNMITGGRFHRLLTSKELEYLFKKLKEEQY
jgi:hypothetical protein